MSAFLPNAAGMPHDGGGGDGGSASSIQPAIVPMENNSIRRIVAGQAVTDLASAVKELVDNALDAGATSINIRLWDCGAKILEVSDDGSGIPLESRPYIAMKNATSKIRSFEDIYASASTLGFRGEALFCLANISQQLLVCTRTSSDESGQRLVFGRDGYLDPESVCSAPRKIGTTVAVVGLFDALPVRKTDMMKRIKTQRAKLVKMMQGYAVLCTGVRFNLMDMVGAAGGQERTFLATGMGNNSLEHTVSAVLGSRFLSGMTRFTVDLTNAIAEDNTTTDSESPKWKVEGLISKAPILTGRGGSSARDHQFFSVNHRPVELPRISRALMDVWRTLEGTNSKRPACVLQFTLPNNAFDVNLSPDKREVFLRDAPAICELIRESLTALWASQSDGTFAANEVELLSQSQQSRTAAPVPSPPREQQAHCNGTGTGSPPSGPRRRARRRMAFVHDLSSARMQHEDGGRMDSMQGTVHHHNEENDEAGVAVNGDSGPQVSQDHDASVGDADESMNQHGDMTANEALPSDGEQIRWTQTKLQFNNSSPSGLQDEIDMLKESNGSLNEDEKADAAEPEKQPETMGNGQRASPTGTANRDSVKITGLEQFAFTPADEETTQGILPQRQLKRKTTSSKETRVAATTTHTPPTNISANGTETNIVTPALHNQGARQVHIQSTTTTTRRVSRSERQDEDADEMDCSDSSSEESPVRPRKLQRREKEQEESQPVVWDSFEGTDEIIKAATSARLAMREQRRHLQETARSRNGNIGTDAGVEVENVGELNQNGPISENEVLGVTKDIFHDMEIIGQFNLGFILARCRNNHLWILDQHACDEKYNFEELCAKTVIHEQKLIAPMPLELSPSEESCILDNMYIFEENGFRFSFDIKKPPRHRLALTSLPHSGAPDGRKAVQFGKEDVIALCAMLGADGDSYAEAAGGGYGTGADGSGLYGNNAVRRYAGVISQQEKMSQNSGETDDEKRAGKIITRLPKAIAMFANRACRQSIMIGTPLSQKEMESIVKKLGKVDNPWNCPHGRPTMRHVRDLAPSLLQDSREAEAHVKGPTLAVMSQFQEMDEQETDEEAEHNNDSKEE